MLLQELFQNLNEARRNPGQNERLEIAPSTELDDPDLLFPGQPLVDLSINVGDSPREFDLIHNIIDLLVIAFVFEKSGHELEIIICGQCRRMFKARDQETFRVLVRKTHRADERLHAPFAGPIFDS